MARKILVTGATGAVGSLVVTGLQAAGASVRALAHSPEKAKKLEAQGVEARAGDFDRAAGLDEAFAGVDVAFVLAPPHPDAGRWNRHLLAAARKAGTPVVRMSALKADPEGPTDNTKQHGASDAELRASGLPYTILRPHFFMQNLLFAAQSIAKDGVMYWGMGDGKLGMIDVRDIADMAVKTLLDDTHRGRTYDPTGPAAISFHDVAAALSQGLGREIKYVPVPVPAVVASIKEMGAGDWFANVMGQYSKAYSEGWGDFTTGDVQAVTGKPARSIASFVQEVLLPALPTG